ncbi:hypothetical protein GCM10023405_23020 [Streptomonospora salina]
MASEASAAAGAADIGLAARTAAKAAAAAGLMRGVFTCVRSYFAERGGGMGSGRRAGRGSLGDRRVCGGGAPGRVGGRPQRWCGGARGRPGRGAGSLIGGPVGVRRIFRKLNY